MAARCVARPGTRPALALVLLECQPLVLAARPSRTQPATRQTATMMAAWFECCTSLAKSTCTLRRDAITSSTNMCFAACFDGLDVPFRVAGGDENEAKLGLGQVEHDVSAQAPNNFGAGSSPCVCTCLHVFACVA